jgi:hypothetical protein
MSATIVWPTVNAISRALMPTTNKARARTSLVRRLLEHGTPAFRCCVVELRQVANEKDEEHFPDLIFYDSSNWIFYDKFQTQTRPPYWPYRTRLDPVCDKSKQLERAVAAKLESSKGRERAAVAGRLGARTLCATANR